MKVEAIDSNNNRRGCILPMIQGAAAGSAAGYVLKYAQPLTSQEKQTPEYKRVISHIMEQRDVFGPENKAFIDRINQKAEKTPAEDVFVKMYDGKKDGDSVKPAYSKFKNAVVTLKKQDKSNASLEELRDILYSAKETSAKNVKRCISAYNMATKNIRPTGFFIAAGAITGALISLINNILRTQVKE